MDFEKLIPEMGDWNGGAGIDIDGWIACAGNFPLAIGYSRIFWPRFVEFEGYVLREGFWIESLRGFERQCPGDRKSVEAVMNHLHIADIHSGDGQNASREQMVYIGRILREIYTTKLASEFPERCFEIYFEETDSDDLLDYQITFFQVPPSA